MASASSVPNRSSHASILPGPHDGADTFSASTRLSSSVRIAESAVVASSSCAVVLCPNTTLSPITSTRNASPGFSAPTAPDRMPHAFVCIETPRCNTAWSGKGRYSMSGSARYSSRSPNTMRAPSSAASKASRRQPAMIAVSRMRDGAPAAMGAYWWSLNPSTRLATTLRFTSLVPPSIELPLARSMARVDMISPGRKPSPSQPRP